MRGVLIGLAALALAAAAARADDLLVPREFRRLQDALDAARPGDRILISGGRPSGLLDADTDDVEIVGVARGRRLPVVRGLRVTGSGVSVRGLVFQKDGIRVSSDGFRVEGCTFRRFPRNAPQVGVIEALGDDAVVDGNALEESCAGAQGILVRGDRASVEGNRVEGRLERTAIDVAGEDCCLDGNLVALRPGPVGIRVEGGGATLRSNRVEGGDLRVRGDGALAEGNTVLDALLGSASLLVEGNGSTLRGNVVIRGGDTGFLIVGSGNLVEDCSVEGNGTVQEGIRAGHGFVVRGSGNLLARSTASGCAASAFRIVGNGGVDLVVDPLTGATVLAPVPLGPGNLVRDCTGTGAGTCGLWNGTLLTSVAGCSFSGSAADVARAFPFALFHGNAWGTGGPGFAGAPELASERDTYGASVLGQPPPGPPYTRPPAQPRLVDPGEFTSGPAMARGRAFHTATSLPNGDVLLVGGQTLDGTPLAAAEVYEREGAVLMTAAPLAVARRSHAAIALGNGRVLACGGFGSAGGTLASAEIFDPATGRWTPAAPLAGDRARHTATLLGDGRVLVAGGYTTSSGSLQYSATTEIYDPSADRWSAGPAPVTPRGGHTATLLPDGRVLLAGGARFGQRIAELFDPTRWTLERTAGDPAVHRVFHAATTTAGGLVLLAGGGPPQAEIFVPSTGRFEAAGSTPVFSLRTTDSVLHATLTSLPDGRCVLLGGLAVGGAYDGGDLVMSSIGLWDPRGAAGFQSFFLLTFDIAVPRAAHTVTPLGDGAYLVAGGLGTSASSLESEARTEIFRPEP